MTDFLIERERAKYEDVWTRPEYRVKAHGLALWQQHREIFPDVVTTAVDLGCGHARLVERWNLEGIDGWGVDFAEAAPDPEIRLVWGPKLVMSCLWELSMGRRFDLGVCADVMEHIPEPMVDRTLARIRDHCDVVIFKIANFPSRMLGHDLHPTMRGRTWWRDRLGMVGRVEDLAIETGRNEYFFRWSR